MMMGLRGMEGFLEQWQMYSGDLRGRIILGPTPLLDPRFLLVLGCRPGKRSFPEAK